MKRVLSILVCLLIAVFAVAETPAPSPLFSSMLYNIKVDPGAGYLIIGKIWASNIPNTVSGGKLIVSKGAVGIYEFGWTVGTVDGEDTLMDVGQAKDMKTGKHEGMPTLTEPGDYTVDFYAADKKFYTYPFKISKAGERIMLDGPWNDWGYFTYPDDDPLRELTWKSWFRSPPGEGQKIVRIALEITNDKDKNIIFTSDPARTSTLLPEWQRLEYLIMNPKGHKSGETVTKAKYLLETDGAYTLTIKIDGNLYGTWKFNVKGNKLEYGPRSIVGKADPMTMVRCPSGAYFYERQK